MGPASPGQEPDGATASSPSYLTLPLEQVWGQRKCSWGLLSRVLS